MPTEATGLEPYTPVEIVDTSATERATFRRCRRRWFLSSVHRLTTYRVDDNLWLGTLVHAGLEAYYKRLQILRWASSVERGRRDEMHADAVEVALDAYETSYEESLRPLREFLTFLWNQVADEYKAVGQLGLDMLQNYFDHEREDPLFDEIVDVERRVFVPILADDGTQLGRLSVKADIVGRQGGVLSVGDHKTASREPNVPQLDLDDQLTAESYAVWQDNGRTEFPEEAVYNVLQKKSVGPPRTLDKPDKQGRPKLSKSKDQATTHAAFVAEIERLGLDRADYEGHLAYLLAVESSEDNPLFQRYRVLRSPAQMESFERNLLWEFVDMQAVGENPERAYPNPSPFNCPSCPVKLICLQMQDDGDVAAIVKADYHVGDPRR